MRHDIYVHVTRDTVRGSSTKTVLSGTRVYVHASRRDDDGLKLLVSCGPYGKRFQIRCDETDFPVDRRQQV